MMGLNFASAAIIDSVVEFYSIEFRYVNTVQLFCSKYSGLKLSKQANIIMSLQKEGCSVFKSSCQVHLKSHHTRGLYSSN